MKTNTFDTLAGPLIRFRDKVGAGLTIRRALYLAVLLLPGTVVILPVLLWFDRRAALRRAGVFDTRLPKHRPAGISQATRVSIGRKLKSALTLP